CRYIEPGRSVCKSTRRAQVFCQQRFQGFGIVQPKAECTPHLPHRYHSTAVELRYGLQLLQRQRENMEEHCIGRRQHTILPGIPAMENTHHRKPERSGWRTWFLLRTERYIQHRAACFTVVP